MSPSIQTPDALPSEKSRAASEADTLILEHGAGGDPDRIEELALKVLLMFEPERAPSRIDLLVIDDLRARAKRIRARRAC